MRASISRSISATNAPHVAPGDVGFDYHPTLDIVAPDLGRTRLDLDLGHVAQAHPSTVRRGQDQVADGLGVGAPMRCQSHQDVVAFVAADHLTGLRPADGILHQIHHLGHRDAEARETVAVGADHELGLARNGLQSDVAGAGQVPDQGLDFFACARQSLEEGEAC